MTERGGKNMDVDAKQVARGLGWFSLGLGALELAAPGKLTEFLGVRQERTVVRAYGLREVLAGMGLLMQPTRLGTWMWSRVAGDVLDLATLGMAKPGEPNGRKRTADTLAFLTATTVLDVLVARALTMEKVEPPTLAGRLLGKGKRK
ncbi:hypothetical protein [Deinococcus hopiensis]|uniref:hypothetical protein n=1 Tax=Deinococcus hopiensis TaxID=309885 RepID=UPI001FE488B8|nr:hypothetical protein [Deinococcus hopiensis]